MAWSFFKDNYCKISSDDDFLKVNFNSILVALFQRKQLFCGRSRMCQHVQKVWRFGGGHDPHDSKLDISVFHLLVQIECFEIKGLKQSLVTLLFYHYMLYFVKLLVFGNLLLSIKYVIILKCNVVTSEILIHFCKPYNFEPLFSYFFICYFDLRKDSSANYPLMRNCVLRTSMDKI